MKKIGSFILTVAFVFMTFISAFSENNVGIRDESIRGRGFSDSGRSELQYVNLIGYVVISTEQEYTLRKTDKFEDKKLWTIPTYKKDKQFWNTVDGITLPHKTEVIVREQELSHIGWGNYKGYLLVERLDNSEQYYINVMNFVTKPYWDYYDDLRTAAITGYLIGIYHQKSDYYPIDNGGEKATIDDGKIVLITGIAGHSRSVDPSTNGIDAVVWQNWRYGYGGVTIHFNQEDLTIIY